MSKVVAAGFAGSGVVAVSVGGTYMLQKGNDSSQQSSPTNKEESKKVDFEDLSKFKKDKGGKCVRDLFKEVEGIENVGSSTEFTKDNIKDQGFFGTVSDSTDKIKGCLVINWEKKENKGKDKGNGIFTGVWAFINDKKGFITFNVIKSVDKNKMNMFGGAYLLEQEGEIGSEKGKIKYHKEVLESSPKEITSEENFDKYFPKEKSGGVVKNGEKANGGFVDSKDKLASICGSTNTCGTDVSYVDLFKKQWNWKKETGDGAANKLADGAKDLQWWEHLYTKDALDLGDKIKDFSGKWEEDAPASVPQESQ